LQLTKNTLIELTVLAMPMTVAVIEELALLTNRVTLVRQRFG
jgi:hypothetical protein